MDVSLDCDVEKCKQLSGTLVCELCEEEDVLSYCPDCKFTLGEFCQSVHRKQKATKLHSLIDIGNVKISDLGIPCTTCDSLAITYCPECEERQCEKCSRIHRKLPATKTHELIDTLSAYKDNTGIDGDGDASLKSTGGDTLPTETVPELPEHSEDRLVADTTIEVDETLLDRPGKPSPLRVSIDFVHITWALIDHVTNTDIYQVRYKESAATEWMVYDEYFEQDNGRIYGLRPDTSYVFSVRLVRDDVNSRYGDESDVIQTHASFASQIVRSATVIGNGNTTPKIYALPMTENMSARNYSHFTSKNDIGPKKSQEPIEKTILLIGANGVGKTTFVDGIANYVLGVTFDDIFRFTIGENGNREKKRDEPNSKQANWITCYSFNPQQGTRINYRLNVIHTPGFADERHEETDQQLIEQIRHLFERKGEKGVQYIDAICFMVKAADSSLNATQKYIFNAVISMFGRTLEQNICTIFTFADIADPDLSTAVDGCGFTFGEFFNFNNSALFVSNCDESANDTRKQWNICLKSYAIFLDYLQTLETKCISKLRKEVQEERLQLEETVLDLRPKIDAGLSKIHQYKEEKKKFEENQAIIESNKDFKYQVIELVQEKVPFASGRHVTNCLQCNTTCHDDCSIADDARKSDCMAMRRRDGHCKVCFNSCHWSQHKNAPYIITYKEVTVTKTYDEMVKKYQEAESNCITLEQVLCKLGDELCDEKKSTGNLMEEFKENKNRLKAIALRPNPVGLVEQIDFLIKAETVEKRPGYERRIEVLNDLRRDAGTDDTWRKIVMK